MRDLKPWFILRTHSVEGLQHRIRDADVIKWSVYFQHNVLSIYIYFEDAFEHIFKTSIESGEFKKKHLKVAGQLQRRLYSSMDLRARQCTGALMTTIHYSCRVPMLVGPPGQCPCVKTALVRCTTTSQFRTTPCNCRVGLVATEMSHQGRFEDIL